MCVGTLGRPGSSPHSVLTNYEPGQTTDFEFSYGLTRDSYLKTEVLRLDGSISCFALFFFIKPVV